MITVDVQTWASVVSIFAVGLAVLGTLSRKIDGVGTRIDKVETRLEAKIDGVEAHLGARIDGLAAHMDAGFARVDTRLSMLEQRSFDLSTRLPALPVGTKVE